MTFDELYRKILEILPDAEMGEDNEGQVVIYTGMVVSKDSHMIPFDGESWYYED